MLCTPLGVRRLLMSYKGTVRNGVVVLPPEAKLPDGTEVEVITGKSASEGDPLVAAVFAVVFLFVTWW